MKSILTNFNPHIRHEDESDEDVVFVGRFMITERGGGSSISIEEYIDEDN